VPTLKRRDRAGRPPRCAGGSGNGPNYVSGLISAALLSVAGASRYYAGAGVVYTLGSRTALAGVPAEEYENYRGTTPEMIALVAVST